MFELEDGYHCRNETVEQTLKTVMDTLKIYIHLYNSVEEKQEDNESQYKVRMASLISLFTISIEKLLFLNLYVRNPLLLLPDNKLTSSNLLCSSYSDFDIAWIEKNSHLFISPGEMWGRLNQIHCLNEVLNTEFKYLKKIRNQYFHTYISSASPKFLDITKQTCWIIFKKLIEVLNVKYELNMSHFLKECELDEDKIDWLEQLEVDDDVLVKKIVEEYPETRNKLSIKKSRDEKRFFVLEKIYNSKYLEFEILQNEKIEDEDGELHDISRKRKEIIIDQEINMDCPCCSKNESISKTGFLSVEISDIEHHLDHDGDYEVWNEPVNANVLFEHFYCINCGFFSDDYSFVESMKEYNDILEEKVWFKWDINEGTSEPYLSELGVEIIKP